MFLTLFGFLERVFAACFLTMCNADQRFTAGGPAWLPHSTHHTSHLTPHISHIMHHASHITPHTSQIIHHTSHLTPHKSYITHHTSHITHYTSLLTPHTSSDHAPNVPLLWQPPPPPSHLLLSCTLRCYIFPLSYGVRLCRLQQHASLWSLF
jgi:hypothetical protein